MAKLERNWVSGLFKEKLIKSVTHSTCSFLKMFLAI